MRKGINLNEGLIKFALLLEGIITEEHGISKSKFLPIEHPSNISLMRPIKELLDKKGILNRGKFFQFKFI